MAEAYIIDALRTPTGRRKGGLSEMHPADLGGHVLKELVDRNDVPGDDYEDVIFGSVDTIGPLAGDIARTCWLSAGLPLHVPGVTIDRQCGSSQQSVHFAAQAVMSGTADVVVAGGVQVMSQIPISAAMLAGQAYGFGDPFTGSIGWVKRFGDGLVTQFNAAEMIAEKWGLSRQDLEQFALNSNERAFRAIDEGRFDREITPVNGVTMDETPRRGTTLDAMAGLQPLQEGGRITAAVSSQTCDAASAMLICSEEAVKRYDLKPRARIHHISVLADDPIWMLTAPMPATKRAMEKTGMNIADIDLVEINEAFAPVVMAWLADTGYDYEKTNVNGGAIALGHPLGATGTKLMTTLLHELERTGGRWGLQTMCEGGGQANVTIIERL
ncbi:MAG: acetyl-CoA C-acetyltransferase [Gammaproteobacteria bacterium]|jgi:acetyl-CoA C-acetyltransferase|nr:acetyl-CoA C-acetyltransferase [Gammaproteobacteria bacterium]MBT4615249.1 acetyl-CoA C-acetyltransferase [Gammaproteobacteria bacterium]MBT5196574.1 acetyl-CoA C-acetyltransferase [Gammaproteobacteria bacterium]MBT5441520.1 acetyl-CoA C-acetyltransferase [Gammaproteobacteria bacterium]MBT5792433.1 acetyl-CoA C-acetyltransferase [Gammaproteobacteria bacterium]